MRASSLRRRTSVNAGTAQGALRRRSARTKHRRTKRGAESHGGARRACRRFTRWML
ncbi:conserved hypothetical protein [Burkholderia pseudomallei 576]|nr:conserved hypothetical protein [Burkholderia pseudomallei 576]